MSTIITKRQFPNYHKYTMELAGRPLTLEVGKLAELANAAVMVGYGDTRVLVCATASARPRDGIDFFPLSVDFEEKMYSVGRIPGSFNRREGRPGEKGILTSRVIDRPIRPLFPSDFRNDVSIMATVMSVDHDCSPEIAALIGTSAALAISDIPWNGPVGATFDSKNGFYAHSDAMYAQGQNHDGYTDDSYTTSEDQGHYEQQATGRHWVVDVAGHWE